MRWPSEAWFAITPPLLAKAQFFSCFWRSGLIVVLKARWSSCSAIIVSVTIAVSAVYCKCIVSILFESKLYIGSSQKSLVRKGKSSCESNSRQ